MRIHFERTGGFTGMRVKTTVETGSLPGEQAEKLRHLIAAADFFELPAQLVSPERGADQFHYKVTVEEEDRHHTVESGDQSAPEELQSLLRELTRLARSQK